MAGWPKRPGYYDRLEFNAPLSGVRADALATALAARAPRTVLDIGCGWAELLLRVLARSPAATGVGVDSDAALVARGQGNAEQRGLADRVRLIAVDGKQPLDPADLVLCVGSDHVYGDQAAALHALRPNVTSGGRAALRHRLLAAATVRGRSGRGSGATPDEFLDLGGLVELAVGAGFRPLDIQTANEDEWNAFESGYLSDWEEWLMRHPALAGCRRPARCRGSAPHAAGCTGYRNVLGFAYLTLGRALATVSGWLHRVIPLPTCARSPSCSSARANRPTGCKAFRTAAAVVEELPAGRADRRGSPTAR